jgi:cell division protein FtsW
MDASIYRMRHRDILSLCVLALLCLGIVMVQSASTIIDAPRDVVHVKGQPDTDQPFDYTIEGTVKKSDAGYEVAEPSGRVHQFALDDVLSVEQASGATWSWSQRGTKHLSFAAVAVLTFFVVGRLNYEKLAGRGKPLWRVPAVWAIALAVFACALVLVPIPGVTKAVNGARRWILLGPVQVQPSEMAKWATVLFLAWWLSVRPLNLDRFWKGFVPTLLPIGALCLLVVIQDFGTAALIALCALTMLLAGRVKGWHLAVVIPPALLAAFAFVRSEPYRWTRMTSFLDPWAAPQGEGYHMVQSLLSFSTGGLFGRGLGNGVQKLGYLPEDTTDFIFAVICEELGLFGALLTMSLYLGILYVAWQTIKEKRGDDFGRLLAFGTASMVGLQAAINMAVATVSVPTKGMSLPLISAGGSGLVITCAALGLLYSVTRFLPTEALNADDREPDPDPEPTPAPAPAPLRKPRPAHPPPAPAPAPAVALASMTTTPSAAAAPAARQPVKLPPPPADLEVPRRPNRVSPTMWATWTT